MLMAQHKSHCAGGLRHRHGRGPQQYGETGGYIMRNTPVYMEPKVSGSQHEDSASERWKQVTGIR
jgi:hypothetical protein